jgi:hypothetical protein
MDWHCVLDAAAHLFTQTPPPAMAVSPQDALWPVLIGVLATVVVLAWFVVPGFAWALDVFKLPLFIWFLAVQYNTYGGVAGALSALSALVQRYLGVA